MPAGDTRRRRGRNATVFEATRPATITLLRYDGITSIGLKLKERGLFGSSTCQNLSSHPCPYCSQVSICLLHPIPTLNYNQHTLRLLETSSPFQCSTNAHHVYGLCWLSQL